MSPPIAIEHSGTMEIGGKAEYPYHQNFLEYCSPMTESQTQKVLYQTVYPPRYQILDVS